MNKYRIYIEDSPEPYYCIEDGESCINSVWQDRSDHDGATLFSESDAIILITDFLLAGFEDCHAEPPIIVRY